MADENWIIELKKRWGERLLIGEPLARHTSFRIGGPAQALIVVEAVDELCEVVLWAREREVPHYVVGQGTNLLIADVGLPGVVIVNRCAGWEWEETSAGVAVRVEAGHSLAALAHRACEAGWSGLEWAAGLPGTVGGAVVGNAGAFGRDISDALVRAIVLDPEGRSLTMSRDELGFGYRTSRFKEEGRTGCRGHVILSAELALARGERERVMEAAAEVMRLRRDSQPIGQLCAGSVFKNPERDYAGRLIEAVNLKGARCGGAQVSPRHANFIVNLGTATAQDVLDLIELVRTRVREQCRQELDLEIECWGLQAQALCAEPKRKAGEDESETRTRRGRTVWSFLRHVPGGPG